MRTINEVYGNQTSAGEEIKYDILYNRSNGFEDYVETFAQRLKEQDALLDGRFELFLNHSMVVDLGGM
ncbi:MAG: hypothetical protein EXR35_08545 [Limnohabitans sp.]|nr:hypothetical protein [Limnohabitans sp.]